MEIQKLPKKRLENRGKMQGEKSGQKTDHWTSNCGTVLQDGGCMSFSKISEKQKFAALVRACNGSSCVTMSCTLSEPGFVEVFPCVVTVQHLLVSSGAQPNYPQYHH